MPIVQPRPEYPRPQFVRKEWINLNGLWGFEMDPAMSGKERGLLKKNIFAIVDKKTAITNIVWNRSYGFYECRMV